MTKNCAGCAGCTRCTAFNSRGCGALHYLGRSSYSCGCDSCNTCNNCHSCSGCDHCGRCNSCPGCNSRANGCNAPADWPCATTCAGNPLYYTGPCGCKPGCCSGFCYKWADCPFGGCGTCENPASAAAEFRAVAPQTECAGGALTFTGGSCACDDFETCHGGVRIKRCGRYIAIYTFAAPAGNNAATTLSLAVNGSEIYASRAYIAPAAGYSSRQAHGQAMFDAQAGDVISLNTSSALSIPDCAEPIASLILLAAGC